MGALEVGEPQALKIPEDGTPIGFDLVASDWVAPHGKGIAPDLVFTLERRFKNIEESFEATLTVSFSNEGDGIQSILAQPFVGSELKLPRYAPAEGYNRELVKRKTRVAKGKPLEDDTRKDQNYFIRVRTRLDEKDHVVSALYGKIDGDIQFWPNGRLRFTYYLNPEANDRNMEFDAKRNFLPKLPELERPRLP